MADKGTTRSGVCFSDLNAGYYKLLKQCVAAHKKLFSEEPSVQTRLIPIVGQERGCLSQTIVRFPINSAQISSTLFDIFSDLFQQHRENDTDGFEVQITFNAILHSEQKNTWHVFYGLHHAQSNERVTERFISQNVFVVKSLLDVANIKSSFDAESLLYAHRNSFADTHVRVHSFINVIYLIHRFVSSELRPRRTPAEVAAEKERKNKIKEEKRKAYLEKQTQQESSTSSSRKHVISGQSQLKKGGKKSFK